MDTKVQARRGIILICAVSFGLIITAGLITAASGYAVTPDNTIDTPSTTVEFEGNEYEINSISEYTPGDTITVDVALPSNDYSVADILLYNSDRNQETSKRIRGPSASETVTLDTGAAPAGTYSINLEVEGRLEAIHPVVLAGFDVAVDAPGSVTVDEDIETKVTVTPTELNNDDLDGVEVVIWNDDQTERIDATADGNNEYTATISADTFESGEYNVYAAALSEDTFNGEAEILGIDDGGTLSITEDDDNGDGGTNGGPSGGGSGAGTGDGGDEEDSTAETDNETTQPNNETDTGTSETDGANNETDGTDGSESTPSDEGSGTNGATEASGESDDLITPTTNEDESPPVEDQPFHPGLAVIAIGLLFVAQKWRTRRQSGTSSESPPT